MGWHAHRIFHEEFGFSQYSDLGSKGKLVGIDGHKESNINDINNISDKF